MVDNTIKTNAIRTFTRVLPYLWKIAAAFLLLILLLFLVFTIKKDAFLEAVLAKAKTNLRQDYGLSMRYAGYSFRGIRTLHVENLSLDARSEANQHHSFPSILNLKNVEVKVSLWALVRGQVALSSISLETLEMSVVQQDSASNYDQLFLSLNKKSAKDLQVVSTANSSNTDFAKNFERVWSSIQRFSPNNFQADLIQVNLVTDSTNQVFEMPSLQIHKGDLSGLIRVDHQDAWVLKGALALDNKQAFLELVSLKKEVEIPYLKKNLNLSFSFDSLLLRLDGVDLEKATRPIQLRTSARITGLQVHQPRLSGDTIQFPQITLYGNWFVAKNFLELGAGSEVEIQKLKVLPLIRYEHSPNSQYTLEIDIPMVEAQDFFDAIPAGLFSSMQGIRAQGKLGFQLYAHLDTAQLDSVRLDAHMNHENFRVNSWGVANPSLLNTAFLHEPYEEDFRATAFRVGRENPGFVPLESISPYLKNAVLTTEDPSFYTHRGFILEAVRESIATNFREKSFKRGASTISMQLIKNVFLHRNKTLVRKLEEMLLVWLMENPRIVSKERQYEVYLNIIEFGPGIYGIKSGSNHYFAKHPADLTIGECIFLASIVPKPKRGMYFFDENGGLRPYLASYFTFVGQIMARRGMIAEDPSGDYGFSTVKLRSGLRPLPPALTDSVDLQLPALNFVFPETVKQP